MRPQAQPRHNCHVGISPLPPLRSASHEACASPKLHRGGAVSSDRSVRCEKTPGLASEDHRREVIFVQYLHHPTETGCCAEASRIHRTCGCSLCIHVFALPSLTSHVPRPEERPPSNSTVRRSVR